MNPPWSPVTEDDAVAQAGALVSRHSEPNVTYALGRAALVVILDAGDRPDRSAVQTRSRVTLRAPFPAEVGAALTAQAEQRAAIHGFVRVDAGCLPLGELVVVSSMSQGEDRDLQEVDLHIRRTLPFDVLDRVRPVEHGRLAGLDWLDALPTDPLRALRGFIAEWYADLPAGDAIPVTDAPTALANFYLAAAGRTEPLGLLNAIFTPDRFRAAGDGQVVFGTECQGVWTVRIHPAEPDPAVYYDSPGDPSILATEPLSGFLVQFAVSDAAIGSPLRSYACAPLESVTGMLSGLRRVPVGAMPWPTDPTDLYVGRGLAVAVCRGWSEHEVEVYVGARRRAALIPLREPGFAWQYFAG